jgi:hypothetical protein
MISTLCSVNNEYKLTCLLHGMYVMFSLQMPNGRATYTCSYTNRGKIAVVVLWNDINVWILSNVQLVGNKYKIIFYSGSIF